MDRAGLIRVAIVASMGLLVFALGLRSSLRDALYFFRKPTLLVRSILAMSVVTPLLVAWLVTSFNLLPPVKIALVALAVSPVPPFLPGKQIKIAHSDDYAISLFVTTALFAVLLVPATMALVMALGVGDNRVSAGSVLRIVASTVLVPLLLGSVLRLVWPAGAARIHLTVSVVAVVLLVAALVPVLIAEWPAIVSLVGDGTLLSIVAATLLGLAVGHVLGGPQPQDRSVLALATASRHPAVAIAVATASFPEQKLVPAAVLLALVVGAVASVPYTVWRRRVLGPTSNCSTLT